MNEMIININDLFNHRSFGASSEINSYNDFTGISGSFLLKESLVKTDLALNIDFQISEYNWQSSKAVNYYSPAASGLYRAWEHILYPKL